MKSLSGREALVALLLYSVLLGLAFVPKWLAGHSFLTEVIWDPTPVYLQYPGDAFAIRSLAAGQLPIWDPARGLGNPAVIPISNSFCSVFKIFAYLIHAPWGWEAYLFLRLLVAGFSTFLLARALPLRPVPAFFAGAAYMLCGYFRIFMNFQHLNMEAWVPLALWSFFRLARKPTLGRMILSIFIMEQCGYGGNPTSAVYGNLLGVAAFAFIAAQKARGSSKPLRRFLRWLFLSLLALGIVFFGFGSLPVLLEFMGQTWNLRLPGIGLLHISWSNLIALATPLFDFWLSPLPPTQETHLALLNFIPAYLGLIVCALALLALLHPARLPRAGLFFILALPFPLGIVFGVPPFHFLSYFPILSTSQNFRYVQGFLALMAALMAGMGLELLLSPHALRLRRTALLILAVLLGSCAWPAALFRQSILASPLLPRFLLGLALALAAVSAVLLAARFLLKVRSPAQLSALALASAGIAELLLYFHLATPLYGPKAYSMAEPPAAAWLRAQPGPFRLLGAEPESLHPNLAELYGLEDIRDSAPIYTRRYLQFVSALDGLKTPDAILAHYFENGRFYLDLDLSRLQPPFLDLLNVRYLLSQKARDRQPLAFADSTAAWLMPAAGSRYISPLEASINGVHRPALLTHAPSRADLLLPAEPSRVLVGDVGMLPESRQNPAADGALVLAVSPAGSERRLLFCRYLDPRREPGERAWIPLEIPLPPAAEKLSLQSLPGPRDNRLSDFAVWGEPGLRQPDLWPNLELVYDRDLRIYENRTAWPRAFWLPRVENLASKEEVLQRLAAPAFNPALIGLVYARAPEPQIPSPAGPARVELVEHGEGRATVRVEAQGGGLLVLSDLYYPGWEARVDGKEARIYPVDLALRGLPMPAGGHEVFFRYNPASVHLALWATLVGYGFALLMLVLKKLFRAYY